MLTLVPPHRQSITELIAEGDLSTAGLVDTVDATISLCLLLVCDWWDSAARLCIHRTVVVCTVSDGSAGATAGQLMLLLKPEPFLEHGELLK
jgi:hypothetical protein